jgi:hypothetical protein
MVFAEPGQCFRSSWAATAWLFSTTLQCAWFPLAETFSQISVSVPNADATASLRILLAEDWCDANARLVERKEVSEEKAR